MMNPYQIQDILDQIKYTSHFGRWSIRLRADGDRQYLQVVATDEATGEPWSGRKWMLSPYMTVTEIVSTAFKAFQAAEDHESREAFTYKGVAIFGPHADVEQLVELNRAGQLRADVRTNAMQGA